jgi:integrase
MASIRKRTWINAAGETRTAWQVDFVDQDGKRHQPQFASRKEADAQRKLAEYQVSQHRYVDDRDTRTFAEACREMLGSEKRRGVLSDDYLKGLDRVARIHVLPAIGAIRLNKLKTERLQELMLVKHEAGYMTKYLGQMRMLITKTIGYACKRGWMTNPLADQPLEALPNRARQQHEPSMEEIRLLVDVAAQGPHVGEQREPFYAAVIVLMLTILGMRRKEIGRQRWEHVDFTEGRWRSFGPPPRATPGCDWSTCPSRSGRCSGSTGSARAGPRSAMCCSPGPGVPTSSGRSQASRG